MHRSLYHLRCKPCVDILTEGFTDRRFVEATLECFIDYKNVFENTERKTGIYSSINRRMLEMVSYTLTKRATYRCLCLSGYYSLVRHMKQCIANQTPYMAVVDADVFFPAVKEEVINKLGLLKDTLEKPHGYRKVLFQMNRQRSGWEDQPMNNYAANPQKCGFTQIIDFSAIKLLQDCVTFTDVKRFYREHMHTFAWGRGAGEIENAFSSSAWFEQHLGKTFEDFRKYHLYPISEESLTRRKIYVRDILEHHHDCSDLIKFLEFVNVKLHNVYNHLL